MGNIFVAALVDTLGHWVLRVIPVWSDMGFAMSVLLVLLPSIVDSQQDYSASLEGCTFRVFFEHPAVEGTEYPINLAAAFVCYLYMGMAGSICCRYFSLCLKILTLSFFCL